MGDVIDTVKNFNGVPVDFQVTVDTKNTLKIIGIVVALTIFVVVVGTLTKKFFN